MQTPKKIRITDIAFMAGVSPGTVDRVLHHRGQVAEESRKKIMSIVEKYHYRPNIFARSLARREPLRIVALLPQHQTGEYWEAPEKGILRAEAEMHNYNIAVEKLYFNQFDAKSFANAAEMLLKSKPDAALLAPTFRNEAVSLMQQLCERNIPGVYIDSNAADDYYFSYFGQNSYQSGYVAAQLLQNGLPQGTEILVVHTLHIDGISNQTQRREEGFTAYFTQNKLTDHYHFVHVKLSVDDHRSNVVEIGKIVAQSRISAAIVFHSRVHYLADIFKQLKINHIRLIGYDLSGDNVPGLKEGLISFLIAQRPEDQGYQGIMALCNWLIFNNEVKRINYVPIDILTKSNVDDYINYNN
ncbi:MAG: substrate-binding domain-containing protein [Bacteroidales bacterium]|jgi:LacI family transcriptional regulator|nr:substrate-binding domain-containing protein [Bacteroidales bacterium]